MTPFIRHQLCTMPSVKETAYLEDACVREVGPLQTGSSFTPNQPLAGSRHVKERANEAHKIDTPARKKEACQYMCEGGDAWMCARRGYIQGHQPVHDPRATGKGIDAIKTRRLRISGCLNGSTGLGDCRRRPCRGLSGSSAFLQEQHTRGRLYTGLEASATCGFVVHDDVVATFPDVGSDGGQAHRMTQQLNALRLASLRAHKGHTTPARLT